MCFILMMIYLGDSIKTCNCFVWGQRFYQCLIHCSKLHSPCGIQSNSLLCWRCRCSVCAWFALNKSKFMFVIIYLYWFLRNIWSTCLCETDAHQFNDNWQPDGKMEREICLQNLHNFEERLIPYFRQCNLFRMHFRTSMELNIFRTKKPIDGHYRQILVLFTEISKQKPSQ